MYYYYYWFRPGDLSLAATASYDTPQHLERTDNKPFTEQIGLRQVTLSQPVVH